MKRLSSSRHATAKGLTGLFVLNVVLVLLSLVYVKTALADHCFDDPLNAND